MIRIHTHLIHTIEYVTISSVYLTDNRFGFCTEGSPLNPFREILCAVTHSHEMWTRPSGLWKDLHSRIISNIHGETPSRCFFPVVTSSTSLKQLDGLEIHSRITNELSLPVGVEVESVPWTVDCLVSTPHRKSLLIVVPGQAFLVSRYLERYAYSTGIWEKSTRPEEWHTDLASFPRCYWQLRHRRGSKSFEHGQDTRKRA